MVRLPAPVKVPPLRVSVVPVIVEADARLKEPPEIVRGSVHVRLWTESVELEWVMGLLTALVIVTSSAGPGTLPVLQLLATSQLPPLEVIQETAERSLRSSRAIRPHSGRNRSRALCAARRRSRRAGRVEARSRGRRGAWNDVIAGVLSRGG
jgi:hypothetical protein